MFDHRATLLSAGGIVDRLRVETRVPLPTTGWRQAPSPIGSRKRVASATRGDREVRHDSAFPRLDDAALHLDPFGPGACFYFPLLFTSLHFPGRAMLPASSPGATQSLPLHTSGMPRGDPAILAARKAQSRSSAAL